MLKVWEEARKTIQHNRNERPEEERVLLRQIGYASYHKVQSREPVLSAAARIREVALGSPGGWISSWTTPK